MVGVRGFGVEIEDLDLVRNGIPGSFRFETRRDG